MLPLLPLLLFLFLTPTNPYKCIHADISSKTKLIPPVFSAQPKFLKTANQPFTPLKITTTYQNNLAEPNPDMDQFVSRLVEISKAFWKRVLFVQSVRIMFPLGSNGTYP